MHNGRSSGRIALGLAALAATVVPAAVASQRHAPEQPGFWPPPILSRERTIAATVRVDSRGGGSFDTGTGVGIGAHVVLTNAHLTRNPVTLVTRCGDEILPVERIAYADDGSDVAVLVTGGADLLPVQLAAHDPQIGDRVLLAGHPQGQLALTEGTIKGTLERGGGRVLQFTPEPQVGQSGSPLLDREGRLVGLAFAQETAGSQGFALPASRLGALLERFRSDHIPIADPVEGDPSSARARSSPCP